MDNVTAAIADFALATQLRDVPAAALHQVKRTLLNFVGCAVGGAYDESMAAALSALGGGGGAASVMGRPETADFKLAALLNGISSAVYSFDDTHAEAVVHPGGPVGAALLAFAEVHPVSGADALLAYTLGAEIVCRLSKSVSVAPAAAGLGWVQTGICGGIGAAVAVGRLLGLNAQQFGAAIGIAASQASGIRAVSRSMCFPLMTGHGARSGLEAALMAGRGFTSAPDSIGAKFGFAEIYADTANLAALTDELGSRYEIEANTFKPYPCGVVIHPAIDAILDLLAREPLDATDVAGVEIALNPTSAKLCDMRHPRDSAQSQSSVQHWTAAAIVDRRAGVRQSRADKVGDPVIVALREKVLVRADEGLGREAAKVVVRLRSGAALESAVRQCRGSQARPMTDAEIEGKFRAQCAEALAPAEMDAIASLVWSMESVADCGEIARKARGRRLA